MRARHAVRHSPDDPRATKHCQELSSRPLGGNARTPHPSGPAGDRVMSATFAECLERARQCEWHASRTNDEVGHPATAHAGDCNRLCYWRFGRQWFTGCWIANVGDACIRPNQLSLWLPACSTSSRAGRDTLRTLQMLSLSARTVARDSPLTWSGEMRCLFAWAGQAGSGGARKPQLPPI